MGARSSQAATAIALVCALSGVPAYANGRFPAANQLVIAPNDPQTLLLRTTFGLLISRDRADHWDWICERAIGYGKHPEDPAIGITSNGTILVGTAEGLAVSSQGGCGWAFANGIPAGAVIVDLVVRPDDAHAALALASTANGTSDAGDVTYASQIYESTDDGASWKALGAAIDPTLRLETIEVAASDPGRVYLSGERGVTNATASVLVSIDRAASFAEHALTLVGDEHAAFVGAVDATNADKVYVRTQGATTSRLLVSANAGKSFDAPYSGGQMLGFALSPTEVYVGGMSDGLSIASTTDLVFAKQSSVQVQCLRSAGASLFACSTELNGFVLGESTNDGATFTPRLHLQQIRGPLACDAGTAAAVCAQDWPDLKRQLGIDDVPDDAGVSDAHADANAGGDAGAAADAEAGADADAGAGAPPSTSSCGCHAAGSSRASHTCFTWAFAALVLARRSRRRS